MVMLDANMILRYLLNDNAEMAEKAHQRWAFFNGESEEEHPSAGAMMRL